MPRMKIMIVEDEVVVSADIRAKLEQLGYEVAPIVRYGEKVLEAVRQNKPDLILMDIKLKGAMDGVEAAHLVQSQLKLPVIFLTAFSDNETLSRAKATDPYAYIKKPVKLDELRINIDISIHKAQIDQQLRESEIRFRTVADYTYDWETWIDAQGRYVYMSPSCERITGYTRRAFMDDPQLFVNIVQEKDRPAIIAHLNGCNLSNTAICQLEFAIIRADGFERWVEHICRPVFLPNGDYIGRRASNRDITERKRIETERENLIEQLQTALSNIKTLKGMIPICANCKKIRDDEGYWNQLEQYISKHSDARFTHSVCPTCMKKLYPDYTPPRNDKA